MHKIELFKKMVRELTGNNVQKLSFKEGGWSVNFNCYMPKHNDDQASAGIKLEDTIYHCFGCNTHTQGAAEFYNAFYEGSSPVEALKKEQHLIEIESNIINKKTHIAPITTLPQIELLSSIYPLIQWSVVDSLGGYIEDSVLKLPITINGGLADIRYKSLLNESKFYSQKNAKAGHIFPYDLWRPKLKQTQKQLTFICAGEKDMLIARSMGLNAYMITGGESKLPKLYKSDFKNQHIVILYDNDKAGILGGEKLAEWLLRECQVASVKNVVNFHEICKENGEDIYDYFTKYNQTATNLINLVKATPLWDEELSLKSRFSEDPLYEYKTIQDTIEEKKVNKVFSSQIKIKSSNAVPKLIPSYVKFTHRQNSQTYYFDLKKSPLKTIIPNLMELPETKILLLYLTNSGVSNPKISQWEVNIGEHLSIYQHTVYDGIELTGSKEYECWFAVNKLFPSTTNLNVLFSCIIDGRTSSKSNLNNIIPIVWEANEVKGALDKFEYNNENIQSLIGFRDKLQAMDVKDALHFLYLEFQDKIMVEAQEDIFTLYELIFHSCKKFLGGRKETKRGVLFGAIIGDSGLGKSETGKKMIETYGAGQIIDMQNATELSLVGGSVQTGSGYKTTAGILPIMHNQLVILEEVQKGAAAFRKVISEMRSQGRARISRVSGVLDFEANVRQVEIANPKKSAPVESFAHGVQIITDLIPDQKDWRRCDLYLIVGRGENYEIKDTNSTATFFYHTFSQQDYKTRLAWAWSREPEDIDISEISGSALEYGRELVRAFGGFVQIFGVETPDKLIRIAIAAAIATVSTNDFFKVIVKKKHLEFAVKFMTDIYITNPYFRLKKYIEKQKRYTEVQVGDSAMLKNAYSVSPFFVDKFFEDAVAHSRDIQNGTYGIRGRSSFEEIASIFTENYFWRYDTASNSYEATLKFKKLYNSISEELNIIKEEKMKMKKMRV